MYLILANLGKTYFEPYPDPFQAYPDAFQSFSLINMGKLN